MKIQSLLDNVNNQFKQNLQDFCKNSDTSKLTEGLAEKFIQTMRTTVSQIGTGAIKEFIESFEKTQDYIVEDGVIYRYKYTGPRDYVTILGKVSINRSVYQADRGGKTIAPLDRHWGMEDEFATQDVRESVIFLSAHETPEATVKFYEKSSLFTLHASTVKRIVYIAGDFFLKNKNSLVEEIHKKEAIPSQYDTFVASMDGVNVLLNEKGVKQGRPTERPDKKEDEKVEHCAHKNAMCGSISFYNNGDGTKKNPAKRLIGKYVSKMPEDKATTFKSDFENEIIQLLDSKRDKPVKKVMLCDGHIGIWYYVEHSPLYKDFEFLIDFYHTTEHLSRAAEAIFGKSNKDGKKWYRKWYKKLQEEDGASKSLLRSIENYYNSYEYTKSIREDLKKERTFFRRNKNKMDYHRFLAAGMPIGSGPVEAACKSLVKQRMCRSGMRWSRKKGDNILQFRTLIKSDRWDVCWDWYKKHRNAA
jgi:hypothetical protein